MRSRSLTTEQVLTLLAETPPRLAALTAGLAPAQLHTRPNHDGWSANEVLAHLRACADVWGMCIMRIIEEDRPTWRAVSPRTWIKQTDYPELAFRPSLGAFTTQRADRCLGTLGASFDGGKSPRTDRAVLCGAAGCP